VPDIRLLLVDTNDDLLDAYAAWLSLKPGLRVAGRAHTCEEAVSRAAELSPDVVVMDVSLPDASGLHATRRIKAEVDGPFVVLTTFHVNETVKREARAAGADACVSKSDITEHLIDEIERLARERKP
jgi:DNA-binding NarL/FixJ family response regulator